MAGPLESDESAGNSKNGEVSQETGTTPPDPFEELRKENGQLRDRLLRCAADFDNYRRQVAKDRENIVLATESGLIREILPVIEDVGRAIAAAGDDVHREGLILIERNLGAVLARHGVAKIAGVGKRFDPSLHDALCSGESGAEEGTILEEYEPGYTMKGLLLRPAKVKIAVKRREENQEV